MQQELLLDHFYIGDVLEKIKLLPDKSVRCIITSVPYYGLRDYQTATWLGGDEKCDHKNNTSVQSGKSYGHNTGQQSRKGMLKPFKDNCGKCGAVRIDQQIGLEKTPELYIEKMVSVFRECRRVLKDDGTLWLNIGDSYWGGKGTSGQAYATENTERGQLNKDHHQISGRGETRPTDHKHSIIKPKDLIGIPWMLAFALRADGWWLRQDIIWAKPSCMPECLDPETTIFVKTGGWISKITLRQLSQMENMPEILSPNGWVKIKDLWKTRKAAIALEAGRVEHVICSPDHKFPISSDRRRSKTRLEAAENIRHQGYSDYFLYCPIGRFLQATITTWMGHKLDYDLGYLLGAYAAEGGQDGERGYRIKLTIHINEDAFKERIIQSCNKLHLAVRVTEYKEQNCQCLFVAEEWFTKTIDNFVSGKVKTKYLNIELLLNTPKEFRQGILDGYIMGDGSDRAGGGWIVSSASRRLRDDFSTLSSSLGIITSKGGQKYYDKRTEKEYIRHWLNTPYITKRKTKSGTEGVFQVPPRRRKQLSGEREMIDLEVEGGVFLIGDGLVTHNSVTDRCTKSHEYIFLLTKSAKYYYDSIAIRQPIAENSISRLNQDIEHQNGTVSPNGATRTNRPFKAVVGRSSGNLERKDQPGAPEGTGKHQQGSVPWEGMTANKRSVWTVSTKPFSGAHFAVMPEALIVDCIKAGTSEHGQCSNCGNPWIRIVEKQIVVGHTGSTETKYDKQSTAGRLAKLRQAAREGGEEYANDPKTVGWQPTCKCNAEIIPDVVLDPFGGAGTTPLVAKKLNRNFVAIELNEKYVNEIAIPRLQRALGMFYKPKAE